MTAAAIYGLLAAALVAGAGASLLPLPGRRWAGIAVTVLAPATVAPWIHGALGAPSFTLALLAFLRLAAPGRAAPLTDWRAAAALAAVAAVFYPLALGAGPWDPFDLGYRPAPLLAALAVLGGWLAWRRRDAWLLLLAADLLAYAGGLFDNLWNALFDPLLAAIAALRAGAALSRRWRRR